MKRKQIAFFILLAACKTAATPGTPGPEGAKGEQGLQGAAGVCDTTSCPPTNSIDALSGGTLIGPIGIRQPEPAAAKGVVVERGLRSTTPEAFYRTTVGGFYCGRTSFDVDGRGYNAAHTYGFLDEEGPWAAKKHCEATCNDTAAHVCTVSEFMMMQDLRAGRGNAAISSGNQNETILWPPYDSVNPTDPSSVGGTGWIRGFGPKSSCDGLSTNSSSATGTTFQTNSTHGFIRETACDATHPLYCCL